MLRQQFGWCLEERKIGEREEVGHIKTKICWDIGTVSVRKTQMFNWTVGLVGLALLALSVVPWDGPAHVAALASEKVLSHRCIVPGIWLVSWPS